MRSERNTSSPLELVTVTRKSVAKQGEVDFLPVRKRKKRKRKKKRKAKLSWDMAWGFLFLLVAINLFFTEGGFLQLLKTKGQMKEGEKYLSYILEENKGLEGEIKKILHDSSYQKKIAREHLGAIAADEYMVIFSKESK